MPARVALNLRESGAVFPCKWCSVAEIYRLTLMNILSKTEDGKLDRIDTYIGVEGNEFVCVGCAKDLSAPGVIFSYGEYVRFQRANKATYLDFLKQNSRSHIIVDGRAYTIDQFLKLY